MHEASLHEENAFITLTYDDAHLPVGATLDREAMPKFFKRLRKRAKCRYFQCGEYGSSGLRPHYHALVFGYGFPDREPWRVEAGKYSYRSRYLERLWPFGVSELSDVTFESAAYVARYCVQKLAKHERERVNLETGELYYVEREYATMSRNPGIGKGWLDKFGGEVFPSDEVIVRGKRTRPPRYYVEKQTESMQEAVKCERERNRKLGEGTRERLHVHEVCTKARLNLYRRDKV